MPDFLLPDLGEGLDEAEVITWRVDVGDRVTVDQVVVEVETAKAAVEIPVPFAGIVARLHAAPGTVLSVGQPLITVAASEASAGAAAGGPAAAGFREPGVVTAEAGGGDGPADDPEAGPEPGPERSGSVLVGYGTSAAPRRAWRGTGRGGRRGAASCGPGAVATRPGPAAGGTDAAGARPGPGADRPGSIPVISPLVRKLARDAGLDLAGIAGTGRAGLILRSDVHRALAQRDAAQDGATQHDATAHHTTQRDAGTDVLAGPVSAARPGEEPGGRRIPLRGARRAMADKLTRSRREIPEATVWVDVDATGLLAARRDLNAAAPDRPVSLLALLARFALLGLQRYPELNARVGADEIIVPGHVHLGFAAQTERGLVVPVVADAHRLTTRELSAALAARTAAARDGGLAPADLTGGTFTVNNYGVFGVDGSAAIINHPEVAILGMGRIIDRPWVVGGQIVVRQVTELTLAFDHRACDGGTAGGFLRYVADCIESPVAALGDL